MEFIWANADDWAFERSVEGIGWSPCDVQQTIYLMHSSYFEGILTVQYTIIEKLIPQGGSCQPWAWKLGEWMKIQAINDSNNTIGRY